MELELKHLSPYLPYGLKCCMMGEIDENEKPVISEITGVSIENCPNHIWVYSYDKGLSYSNLLSDTFPILRPMSDLKTDFFDDLFHTDIDVRTFLNGEFLESRGVEDLDQLFEFKIEWFPFGLISLLIKYHFDIFGLIDKKLAIDINTLKPF